MKIPLPAFFSKTSAPPPQVKSGAPLTALHMNHSASWTPRHYTALSKEGYQRNPVAYRCIRMVAEAAASVRLCARRDGDCAAVGPAARLLRGADVMESFYGYLQVSGNAYLEAAMVGGVPAALYPLRPDRMSVKTNPGGWLCGYAYDNGGTRRNFHIDVASGRSAIFHMKLFHPAHDTLGFSPLEAAAQSVSFSLW